MAVGHTTGSALSLPSVGVSHLADAAIPVPTAESFFVLVLAHAGAGGELADPRPEAFAKAGVPARLFGVLFFDRIHVLPRERDLGSVVSEQEIEVEVYNGYLATAQSLDDITVEGPAGIEVENPHALPTHFPASESKLYVVKVSAEGDPQIDNLVTWEFDGLDPSGSALAIVGFRLIPYPFPANMARPIAESFGYLTDIIKTTDGTEQRIQLRAVPVGTVGFSAYLGEPREAQMANAILFGNQPRAFGVPRWQFSTPLAADADVEDLAIYCTTSYIPFVEGGLVMLWTSPFAWEVQTIESVESDHLTIATGLRFGWTATQTLVVPMVVGRLSKDEAISWETLRTLSQSVDFDIDGFTP